MQILIARCIGKLKLVEKGDVGSKDPVSYTHLPEVLHKEITAKNSATKRYRRLLKTTMGETQENNIQQTSEQDLWQEEAATVSYTHLDVYKRQRLNRTS